eukprot:TRINITY_DN1163_c0_g1_i2.p1 TRINITY_DN1163_c0_g1~~TRINITY_DN1163_c0_g1_i2.p1  ORF type:complete len:434 (+),score=110.82 TRINITY_DN1163_c0_g1_i2:879-2180(+)
MRTCFFQNHPSYRQVAARCGVSFLSKSLNKILMNHIRDTLPELRHKVNTSLTAARNEMSAIGDETEIPSKGALLLNIINSFVQNYNNTIDGRLSSESPMEGLYGGARINYVFNDVFGNFVDGIEKRGGLSDEIIQITMMNSTGPKSSLFVPEESFEQLARMQIKILEEPSLRCIDLVHDELQRILNCIEVPELKRYNNLREKIIEVVNNLLRAYKQPTREMVRNLIQVELAHINTNHPDFIGGEAISKLMKKRAAEQESINSPDQTKRALLQQQQQQQLLLQQQKKEQEEKRSSTSLFAKIIPPKKKEEVKVPAVPVYMDKVPQKVVPKPRKIRSENEDFQIELIELLLKSYFKIVKKNIKDRVPKTIMHFMVNTSKERVQNELVRELYRDDLFASLLEESDDISQKRENLRQMIYVFSQAQRHLNEIIDYRI